MKTTADTSAVKGIKLVQPILEEAAKASGLSTQEAMTASILCFAAGTAEERACWAKAAKMMWLGLLKASTTNDLATIRQYVQPSPAPALSDADTRALRQAIAEWLLLKPEAQQLLRQHLQTEGWAPTRLARKTGIERAHVSRWLHGHRRFGVANVTKVLDVAQTRPLLTELLNMQSADAKVDLIVADPPYGGVAAIEVKKHPAPSPTTRRRDVTPLVENSSAEGATKGPKNDAPEQSG